MDLNDYRKEIDALDTDLVRLFSRRMETVVGVARYKEEHGLPVLDAGREQAKLADIAAQTPAGLEPYATALYRKIFELSRDYQNRLLGRPGDQPKTDRPLLRLSLKTEGLYPLFALLRERNLPLSRFESRPDPARPGVLLCTMEISADPQSPAFQQCLEEMPGLCLECAYENGGEVK